MGRLAEGMAALESRFANPRPVESACLRAGYMAGAMAAVKFVEAGEPDERTRHLTERLLTLLLEIQVMAAEFERTVDPEFDERRN